MEHKQSSEKTFDYTRQAVVPCWDSMLWQVTIAWLPCRNGLLYIHVTAAAAAMWLAVALPIPEPCATTPYTVNPQTLVTLFTHQANDVECDPECRLVHINGGIRAQCVQSSDQLVDAGQHQRELLLDVLW